MEMLLSACSTYDKKITLPGKQKRYYNVGQDDGYALYSIEPDVSDIMVHTKNASRYDNTSININSKSTFLPQDEWNKLTQDQKDSLIAKCRQERIGNNEGTRKPF
jgi:hypothetical protein